MAIGKRKRRTNGPSDYHRSMAAWTCYKVKAALRWTIGGAVTLRTISDWTAKLFGEDDRVTEKGILGNPVTERLYYRFTTSRRRKTSRVRPKVSRAIARKPARVLRVELVAETRRADEAVAARIGDIVAGRDEVVAKAEEEARAARRAAPRHAPPAVVAVDPQRVPRGRARRGRPARAADKSAAGGS
jgi:hypothetical protein